MRYYPGEGSRTTGRGAAGVFVPWGCCRPDRHFVRRRELILPAAGLAAQPAAAQQHSGNPTGSRREPARSAQQEKFDRLTINGVIYTNVLLRTINASEGAMHHDGGLEKIQFGDLPEAIQVPLL